MPTVKKIPERKCTGCGESKPKKELLRIVRAQNGEISVDLTGKKPGRGAYICRDAECLKKARKSGRIQHSLGGEITDEIFESLKQQINTK